MKNFIFTTERYDEEAKRYSASKEIDKIRGRMEKTPEYEPDAYNSFPGNFYKFVFNNFRLIFTRKVVKIKEEDVRIYIALRILPRGDKEYVKFQFSGTSEHERNSITEKSSIDWAYYIRLVESELKPTSETAEAPTLTDAEINFISSPLDINHQLFDVTIYETIAWIRDVQKEDFTDFSNAAETIENYIYDNLQSNDGWHIIEFKNKAILVFHGGQNWTLDRILDKRDNGDYNAYLNQSKPVDFQRGYPFDFLGDKDVWRIMEQDKKSNMVLSQQQVEIVSGEIEYPLFLTGRAGSGKSTILQYLFAEIVLRHLSTMKNFNDGLKLPVYLSYSSNLISDARNLCKTLFEKNNVYLKHLKECGIEYKSDINPLMDKMFFVFNDLLRLCIDNNSSVDPSLLFPTEKYISFPIYNSLWEKKFGKIPDAAKKYGPTISWHVIRTYIKGWDSNHFMTPEEYATIGEKNQTVGIETFKTIYEQVWECWYSKIEDLWDDQDIVRYCLKNNLVDDLYSAIFCDEAQDFTRVEIDLILRLSSFSSRSLQSVEYIKKLPFVFAGDEFQTLNPTGFSWSSLSSYFTESLCNSTGLGEHINELGVPDPIELSENFRSTRQVVRLANRIQLLRASRFGEYSKPQTPHFSEDGNSVYCVSPSNEFIINKLKDKKVILIVPAADGESVEDYIDGTPLKGQIEFENGVPQDITILNPTQAKGLEYPNVAIYGFNCDNRYARLSLTKLLEWFKNPSDDSITDIELKYQISNAYVAVTRAGSNLYILDEFNESSFWAFAFNHDDPGVENKVIDLQNHMLSRLSDSQKRHWLLYDNGFGEDVAENEQLTNNIGWIDNTPEGFDVTDENLSYLRSDEHKNDLENRAEALHDSRLMRQAACIHKSAGNEKDEARCKAKAYNFEEDYLKAAECFAQAEDYESAINNYWIELNNKADRNIIPIIAEFNNKSHDKKVLLCVMCANPSVRNLKLATDAILTILNGNPHEHATIGAWQFVLNYILKNIKPNRNDGIQDIPVIVDNCQPLAENGILLDQSKLALLAYKIGATEKAIDLWDNMDKSVRPTDYYFAKLATLNYPETIEYYEGTLDENWMHNLLRDYRSNKGVIMNDFQKRIISSVVISIGSKEEFLNLLPFMLRSAYNIESSHNVLNDADKFGCDLNKAVLSALIDIRFTELTNWREPKQRYVAPEAYMLFDAVKAIKRMREGDFIDYLSRSLKQARVIDFANDYTRFSRKSLSKLIFMELGRCFETRGVFTHALIYYNWARNQSDDEGFKRAMDIRWIVCKERQAEYERDDSTERAIYLKEAFDKRKELQIMPEEKLPEIPTLSLSDWESLFAFYVNVSGEESSGGRRRSNRDAVVKESHIDAKTADRKSSNKQELRYKEYSIVVFPDKREVVIKNTDEYSMRIKNGVIPMGGDFILKNSRLYFAEENTPTPFVFDNEDNGISIKIYDDDSFSGISIEIDTNV